MSLRPPTEKQAAILEFVRAETVGKGRPPTLAEIGQHFSMKAPSVADHLDALEAKGHLLRTPGERRNIRLLHVPEAARDHELPLLGRIAAGVPLLSTDHVDQWISLSPQLFKPRADFLLRVRGDSMVEVGINSGDLVAIHEQATAEDGQIVAALVLNPSTGDLEMTLKRLRVTRKGVALISQNRAKGRATITVTPQGDDAALRIVGIYVGHLHVGASAKIVNR